MAAAVPASPIVKELQWHAHGRAHVVLAGSLDVHSTAACWRDLQRRFEGHRVQEVEVDVHELAVTGGVAFTLLRTLSEGRLTPGARVSIHGLNAGQQQLLELFGAEGLPPSPRRVPLSREILEEIGALFRGFWEDWRDQMVFTGQVIRILPGVLARPKRLRLSEIKRVFESAGVNALGVVGVFSGLVGLVLALEAAHPLAQFGAQLFVADMIGFATIRDTGPLVTAIMLAGRSSSAFAAELGTMKVNQELDALTTMGLNPVRFLVVQRMIATVLLTPMLTLYAMVMGMIGGILVLRFLGFPPLMIFHQIISRVHIRDLAVGLIKSMLFGVIIGGIGCMRGLQTKEGPSAVGVSTTRAVVSCILLIIAANTVISAVLYSLKL